MQNAVKPMHHSKKCRTGDITLEVAIDAIDKAIAKGTKKAKAKNHLLKNRPQKRQKLLKPKKL